VSNAGLDQPSASTWLKDLIDKFVADLREKHPRIVPDIFGELDPDGYGHVMARFYLRMTCSDLTEVAVTEVADVGGALGEFFRQITNGRETFVRMGPEIAIECDFPTNDRTCIGRIRFTVRDVPGVVRAGRLADDAEMISGLGRVHTAPGQSKSAAMREV
jgi:hypothetical protein